MENQNPYQSPAATKKILPTKFSSRAKSWGVAIALFAGFALLVRHGYTSRTGPVWYYILQPAFALLTLTAASTVLPRGANAGFFKSCLPFLACLAAFAIYLAMTLSSYRSPIVFFEFTFHLAAAIAGAVFLVVATHLLHQTVIGWRTLIFGFTIAIFLGTTALGDILCFTLARLARDGGY